MGRKDPPAKKQKISKTDAELAGLSPDEIAAPASIPAPAPPGDGSGGGDDAPAPAPVPDAPIEGKGIGYLNPPGFIAARPAEIDLAAELAREQLPPAEHVHGPGCAHGHGPGPAAPITREAPKVGRNDPCPCGSGKKYKKCCGT